MRTNLLVAGGLAAAALALQGCIAVSHTTHNNDGWSGKNAAPFDGAIADCEAAHSLPRDIDACMAAKGWTRK